MDKIKTASKRNWLALAACVAIAGGLTATWQQTVRHAEAADDEETPLMKAMEIINSNYKKIRRQARRKSFDESTTKMVQEMQTQSLIAMHQPVPMAEKLSGDKKKEMTIGYKKGMAELVTLLMKLEILLDEGNKDEAAKVIMEELAASKKDGHEKFTEDE